MRTQYRKAPRSLPPIAGVALAVACAAGIVASIEWIRTASGSPGSIVAPATLSPELAQHGNADTALPDIRPSRARCPACDVIGSARNAGKPLGASDPEQCGDHASSAAVTTGSNHSADNADLVLLLDWHMNAANGYGFGLDGISCSAQAAMTVPIPIETSEAYETLARVRDGPGQGLAETSRSTP